MLSREPLDERIDLVEADPITGPRMAAGGTDSETDDTDPLRRIEHPVDQEHPARGRPVAGHAVDRVEASLASDDDGLLDQRKVGENEHGAARQAGPTGPRHDRRRPPRRTRPRTHAERDRQREAGEHQGVLEREVEDHRCAEPDGGRREHHALGPRVEQRLEHEGVGEQRAERPGKPRRDQRRHRGAEHERRTDLEASVASSHTIGAVSPGVAPSGSGALPGGRVRPAPAAATASTASCTRRSRSRASGATASDGSSRGLSARRPTHTPHGDAALARARRPAVGRDPGRGPERRRHLHLAGVPLAGPPLRSRGQLRGVPQRVAEVRSSTLIAAAVGHAVERWGPSRCHTYVDPEPVRSSNPVVRLPEGRLDA